jgi:hypothetical protein
LKTKEIKDEEAKKLIEESKKKDKENDVKK